MKTIKTILKISSVILAVVIISFLTSCKKEYECSCTDTTTVVFNNVTTVDIDIYTLTSSEKCWELNEEIVVLGGGSFKTDCSK